jgi:hypothetical protein
MSPLNFKPTPKLDSDRIFCCPLLPITALTTLMSSDLPPPSPTNPLSPTEQQIYNAHIPIKTSITMPGNPLIWILRNFMVWAESHDAGLLEEGSPFVRKVEAGIECYGMGEKVIRACHGLRVSMYLQGKEEGSAECVKYFLPLFDASPEIKEGESRRICRFSEVPWQVVEIADTRAIIEFPESFSCSCEPSQQSIQYVQFGEFDRGDIVGKGKVYKCAYVGEIKIDTRVLEEAEKGEEMRYNVGWGSVKSKVIHRVKEMDFGWGWSGKGVAP